MEFFYTVKANFTYQDFVASIEKDVLTSLEDRKHHIKILLELEERIKPYLENFELTDFYEMPFVDTEGRDNGYFLRKLATHKKTMLKGKLELMVKRLDK